MSQFISSISDSLRFRFVTANTPSYLFRYFQVDPSVTELSKRFSSQEIVDELRKCVNGARDEIDDSVAIYMLVVALALQAKPAELTASFRVRWFDELIALGLTSRRAFSITTAKVILPSAGVVGSPVDASRLAITSVSFHAPLLHPAVVHDLDASDHQFNVVDLGS